MTSKMTLNTEYLPPYVNLTGKTNKHVIPTIIVKCTKTNNLTLVQKLNEGLILLVYYLKPI